jgi:dsRNA-specific ribonuclease
MLEEGFDVQNFFLLNGQDMLFQKALKPKSMGGDQTFKILALYGDKVIDLVLAEFFSKEETVETGIITPKIGSLVNKRTLLAVANYFKIKELMMKNNPINQLSDNDVKEAIEALIGAAYKVHGFDKIKPLVIKVIDIIYQLNVNKKSIIDSNPKGQVLEIFQQIISRELKEEKSENNRTILPDFSNTIRVGGEEHNPLFQTSVKVQIMGEIIEFSGKAFHKKQEAERDVAKQILVFLKERSLLEL